MVQVVKNLPAMQEDTVQSLGQEDPQRVMATTPLFLPGEFHGQGAWQATVRRVAKIWAQTNN